MITYIQYDIEEIFLPACMHECAHAAFHESETRLVEIGLGKASHGIYSLTYLLFSIQPLGAKEMVARDIQGHGLRGRACAVHDG